MWRKFIPSKVKTKHPNVPSQSSSSSQPPPPPPPPQTFSPAPPQQQTFLPARASISGPTVDMSYWNHTSPFQNLQNPLGGINQYSTGPNDQGGDKGEAGCSGSGDQGDGSSGSGEPPSPPTIKKCDSCNAKVTWVYLDQWNEHMSAHSNQEGLRKKFNARVDVGVVPWVKLCQYCNFRIDPKELNEHTKRHKKSGHIKLPRKDKKQNPLIDYGVNPDDKNKPK